MQAQTLLLMAFAHLFLAAVPLRAQMLTQNSPLIRGHVAPFSLTEVRQPVFQSTAETVSPCPQFSPSWSAPLVETWRPVDAPISPWTYCPPTCHPPNYCPQTFCPPVYCLPTFCPPILPNAGCNRGVKITPYGWLSGLHGSTTIRGVTQDIDVSSSKLFDYLDLVDGAAFARMELDNGPFGVLFDTYYISLGLDREIAGFDFSAQFEMAIVELLFSYKLQGLPEMLSLPPYSEVEVLAGGRYWLLQGAGQITGWQGIVSADFDGKRDWVDPIIGGRWTMPLNPLATIQVRGDLGGFGWGTASKFTWNAEALIERRWSEACTLIAGYRIMSVDNRRGSGNREFAWDMQFRGPIFQIAFQF